MPSAATGVVSAHTQRTGQVVPIPSTPSIMPEIRRLEKSGHVLVLTAAFRKARGGGSEIAYDVFSPTVEVESTLSNERRTVQSKVPLSMKLSSSENRVWLVSYTDGSYHGGLNVELERHENKRGRLSEGTCVTVGKFKDGLLHGENCTVLKKDCFTLKGAFVDNELVKITKLQFFSDELLPATVAYMQPADYSVEFHTCGMIGSVSRGFKEVKGRIENKLDTITGMRDESDGTWVVKATYKCGTKFKGTMINFIPLFGTLSNMSLDCQISSIGSSTMLSHESTVKTDIFYTGDFYPGMLFSPKILGSAMVCMYDNDDIKVLAKGRLDPSVLTSQTKGMIVGGHGFQNTEIIKKYCPKPIVPIDALFLSKSTDESIFEKWGFALVYDIDQSETVMFLAGNVRPRGVWFGSLHWGSCTFVGKICSAAFFPVAGVIYVRRQRENQLSLMDGTFYSTITNGFSYNKVATTVFGHHIFPDKVISYDVYSNCPVSNCFLDLREMINRRVSRLCFNAERLNEGSLFARGERLHGVYYFDNEAVPGGKKILKMHYFDAQDMKRINRFREGVEREGAMEDYKVCSEIPGSTSVYNLVSSWLTRGYYGTLPLVGPEIASSKLFFLNGNLVCGKWTMTNGNVLTGMVSESTSTIRGDANIISTGETIQGEFDSNFLQTKESAEYWEELKNSDEICQKYSCPIIYEAHMYPYIWKVDQKSYGASAVADMMLKCQTPVQVSLKTIGRGDWYITGSAYTFNRSLCDMIKNDVHTNYQKKKKSRLDISPVNLIESQVLEDPHNGKRQKKR